MVLGPLNVKRFRHADKCEEYHKRIGLPANSYLVIESLLLYIVAEGSTDVWG